MKNRTKDAFKPFKGLEQLKLLKLLCIATGSLLLVLSFIAALLWFYQQITPWLFSVVLLLVTFLVPFVMRSLDRLGARIERERTLAEQSRQTLITYVRVLSHEVGNPIAGIMSNLDSLQDQLNTPAQIRELSRMQHSAQMASDVLQNIVTMNKGSSPIPATPRNTNLRETVEGCFRIIRFSNSNGLDLGYNVDDSVPELVICDPLRVSQILLNLLGNAVKYTQSGSVDLDVLSFNKSETCITQFTITDQGPGIAEKDIEKLFLPYQKGRADPAPGFASSGLGLALVKQLVDEMGGDIEVDSRVNVGSCFIVRLPLTPAVKKRATNISVSAPAQRAIQQPRVLVAEDNEINQLVAQRMLEKLGCDVTVAANGLRACELQQEQSFDLILMDLQMPVMDGISATRKIIEEEKAAPHIVAMTANVLEEERYRCIEAGMSDFLSKPVKLDNLRSCLRKHGLL